MRLACVVTVTLPLAAPPPLYGLVFCRDSESFHALDFNFSEPFPEDGCRSRRVSVRAETAGVVDAVMMTWDLALHGGLTYSTR